MEQKKEEEIREPFKETSLITDLGQIQFLIKSIQESFGSDFTCRLLYRASRDGWQSTDFHSRCDQKGPTVAIVKVDNGRLCGGYCSIGWQSSGEWQQDSTSFVFSLDSLKKYNGSQEGHSGHIFWSSTHGPYFGDNGSLGPHDTMNEPEYSYCYINQQSLAVPGDDQG